MKTERKINYRFWIALTITIAAMGAWGFIMAPPSNSAPASTSTAAAPASTENCPHNNMNCDGGDPHYRNNDYRDPAVDRARNSRPMSENERKVYMCGGLTAIAAAGAYHTKGESIRWTAGIAGASCGWTTLFD